jgi:hypothetical protein
MPAGIRITGAARNVVVTGIKVRGALNDGIRVENGAQRVVIDHVSVTDSRDGNVDVVGADTRDVTISWSILGDNAKASLVSDNATRVTMHHNVFVGASERNPLASFAALQKCPMGAPDCNGDDFETCANEDVLHTIDSETTLDMVNNVVWNWPTEGTKVRLGAMANVVANVFRTNGASNENTSLIVCPRRCPIQAVGACQAGETRYDSAAFARGNDNVALGAPGSIDPQVNTTVPAERFAAPPVTQKAAIPAACDVLDFAGARSLTSGWTLDGTDQPLIDTVSLSGCN